MKGSTLRACSWLHKWSSLLATVFLLLLCLTGLPLIFHDEIENAFAAPLRETGERAAAARDADGLDWDALVAHARAQGTGRHVNFLLIEQGGPYVQVGTSDSPAPGRDEGHVHWYGKATGMVLEPPRDDEGGFLDVMLRLHTDLYSGLAGTLFLGAMGLLLAASLISGAVLYAPFMRNLAFGTIRHRRARLRWLDLHNLLGIATLVWLFVVGSTGTISSLEVPIGQLWRQSALLPMVQRYAVGEHPMTIAPLSEVLASIRTIAPDTEPASIIYPGMAISGPRHFLVIMRGNHPATNRVVDAVLVDAESARVVAHTKMPWYVQVLSFSQPLHFGDYGGLPLKILWALLDVLAVIVLGSGIYLWLKKKPQGRAVGGNADVCA